MLQCSFCSSVCHVSTWCWCSVTVIASVQNRYHTYTQFSSFLPSLVTLHVFQMSRAVFVSTASDCKPAASSVSHQKQLRNLRRRQLQYRLFRSFAIEVWLEFRNFQREHLVDLLPRSAMTSAIIDWRSGMNNAYLRNDCRIASACWGAPQQALGPQANVS